MIVIWANVMELWMVEIDSYLEEWQGYFLFEQVELQVIDKSSRNEKVITETIVYL